MENSGDWLANGDSRPSTEFRPRRALQPGSLAILTMYDSPGGRWGPLDSVTTDHPVRGEHNTEPLYRVYTILPDLRTTSDYASTVIGSNDQVEDRVSISIFTAST